jgi:hypothetical protein
MDDLKAVASRLYALLNEGNSDFPNSADQLFVAGKTSWHLNACIDQFGHTDAYADGYLHAAKLLARIVIYSERGMDTLVYPIVYLYRHFIEIKFKSLIRRGTRIVGKSENTQLDEVLKNHDLEKLWKNFKPIFAEISKDEEDFESTEQGIDSYIRQIHGIDPGSFAFRYETTKDGKKRNLDGVAHINVLEFCQVIEKLTGLMEYIDYQFSALEDHLSEMNNYY